MSEVRSLSSLQSQIPTVSFLSSFSPTSSNETLTQRNRGQSIFCVTASTSGTRDISPHGESDVRGEISVFTLETDPHCIFPFVILPSIKQRNVDAKKQRTTNLLRHCQHVARGIYRHTESRMSEVRSLSSLQSQIPTVSFLSSFSPTSSNETLTPRNKL